MTTALEADRRIEKTARDPVAGGERSLLTRFLVDFVWPCRRNILFAFIYAAALAAVTGSYSLIIKMSFDKLGANSASLLPWVIGGVIGATMLRGLFLYLQTVATNRVVLDLTNLVQKRAFGHLMSADFATLSREAPGQLVSRLTNDVGFIGMAAQAALISAVRDSLMVLGQVAAMIYIDPLMALIVLGVYPIAAAPIAGISQRLRTVAKRTQVSMGDMTALLSEQLSGARLIKTYGLESYAAQRVDASFDAINRLKLKAVRNRARIDPLLEVLGGIAVAGVIALAYWRISMGVATIGDFLGFNTALLLAAQPIRALGNLSARVREGLAAAERIYQVIDEAPRVVDRPGAHPLKVTAGEIKFENVAFHYDAPPAPEPRPADADPAEADKPADHLPPALQDVNLLVQGRTTVAFVGRSGAGKSTIINLVPRLFDVTSGAIRIDNQDVRDVELKSLRAAIAIVSQDVTLFDDTIAANIALGRLDATRQEIEAAARAAAAHEFIVARPDGYDTRIGDRGLKLSGGQRQRIALARAILKDAPILLLDEATSALDSHSERQVQEALQRFTKTRTTLVIAHRLSTVMNADMICVMDEGRLVETGTHVELVARNRAYAQLSRAQLMSAA